MNCLGCKNPEASFVLRNILFQKFTLDEKPPYSFDAHAVDQTYMCIKCGWLFCFGIVIDKEHYDENKEIEEKARLGAD